MGKPAELALKTYCFMVVISASVGSQEGIDFIGHRSVHTNTERLWKVGYNFPVYWVPSLLFCDCSIVEHSLPLIDTRSKKTEYGEPRAHACAPSYKGYRENHSKILFSMKSGIFNSIASTP
jgi:hypothetical protein